MLKMEKTCGNCPNIKVTGTKNTAFAGCSKTGFIIPHSWDGNKTENQFVFWRIPLECPLTRDDIIKSKTAAPKKDWVIKSLSDFKISN
jgi:hypothetical protein